MTIVYNMWCRRDYKHTQNKLINIKLSCHTIGYPTFWLKNIWLSYQFSIRLYKQVFPMTVLLLIARIVSKMYVSVKRRAAWILVNSSSHILFNVEWTLKCVQTRKGANSYPIPILVFVLLWTWFPQNISNIWTWTITFSLHY